LEKCKFISQSDINNFYCRDDIVERCTSRSHIIRDDIVLSLYSLRR